MSLDVVKRAIGNVKGIKLKVNTILLRGNTYD